MNFESYFLFAYQIRRDAIDFNKLPPVSDEDREKQISFKLPQKEEKADKVYDLEEEKQDAEMTEVVKDPLEIEIQDIPIIPLNEYIKPDWMFVQVEPAIRIHRQGGGFSYSYSKPYENVNAIPRLFWFNKNQTTYEVFKHTVTSFMPSIFQDEDLDQPIDVEDIFAQKFENLIESVLDKGEDSDFDQMSQDMTNFPFALNLVNPNARSYYAPPCRNCSSKCENCPLPLSSNRDLNSLLESVAHRTKFKDNYSLFTNQREFRKMQESDDDDEGNTFPKNKIWNKFTQSYSDEEDKEEDEESKKKRLEKEDRRGRLKIVSFELIYVNRVLRTNVDKVKSKLLSFASHPRSQLEKKETYTDKYGKVRVKKPVKTQTLQDCLEFMRITEKLDKENSWYCSKCKDHVEATKRIEIFTVPPVLIFCLQRFKSHNIYFKEKLEDHILFPLEDLDLSPYVVSEKLKAEKTLKYDCFAVSNHYGSLQFGHYTATTQNPYTKRWHYFNDSSVDEVHDESEIGKSAYVMYYVRKDLISEEGEIDYQSLK